MLVRLPLGLSVCACLFVSVFPSHLCVFVESFLCAFCARNLLLAAALSVVTPAVWNVPERVSGVVCPSAALATWTCDLNTHVRTCTQHHIVTGQDSEQSACLAPMQKDVCRKRGTRSQADNEFQSLGGSWEATTAASSTETHTLLRILLLPAQ